MELGLKGRTAVITGGSKGIGRAIARGLAREGVNLVLIARGKEQLEKAADESSTLSTSSSTMPGRRCAGWIGRSPGPMPSGWTT